MLSAGSLDLTFGGTGKVVTDFTGEYELGSRAAIQSDGKIVVVGGVLQDSGTNLNMAIARYNADGSLDDGFDGDGVVVTDSGYMEAAAGVAIQNDGKILVSGLIGDSGWIDGALLRYNSDGSLDTDFGTEGGVQTDFGGDDVLNAIAIQPDGKIVTVGFGGPNSQFIISRYHADGSIDTDFGTGGGAATYYGGAWSYADDVAIQPDGKIVVVGASHDDERIALARYNTDGTLDVSFSGDGKVTHDFSDGVDIGSSLEILPNGRILVGGAIDSDFAVVRYYANGSIDTTFGTGGKTTTDFGTLNAWASALAVQQDGSIVLGGTYGGELHTTSPTPGAVFALARYSSNGSLDTTFGTNGKVTTAFGGNGAYGDDLLLQPDGKIVVAGTDANQRADATFAVARYDGGTNVTPGKIGVFHDNKFLLDTDNNGHWNSGVDRSFFWGLATDTPLVGDWNGDGYDEVGVQRGNRFLLDYDGNGKWTAGVDTSFRWGLAGDTAVVGDWNGDGADEIGVRRGIRVLLDVNGNGQWTAGVDRSFVWGQATDTPLIGDWNGNGTDSIGVWRNGRFILDVNGSGTWTGGVDRSFAWGYAGDTPLVGDWNGSGVDTVGAQHNSRFLLDANGNGAWTSGVDQLFYWGAAGDTPLVGDWNGDGSDAIAVQRGARYIVDYNGNGTWTSGVDRSFVWGFAGDAPLVGNWAAVSSLLAAAPAPADLGPQDALTLDAAAPLVAAARNEWLGESLTASQETLLSRIDVRIADLPGQMLGQAVGTTITLDIDAAGWGWFVDLTPEDDLEFEFDAHPSAVDAQLHMDLLTTVLHEMGHVVGFGHDDDFDVMVERLAAGTRHRL